jgi:hypothetical protein
MNKSSSPIAAAMRVVGPKILQMLRNNGVRMAGGAALGAGVGEAENRFLYDPLAKNITGDPDAAASPLAHGGSRLLGALTGALATRPGQLGKQLAAYVPKITALSGVEALNQGTKAFVHDAPIRQRIAETQLSAANAAKDTAGLQQSAAGTALTTAKLLAEKAKNLSHTDKALYGVAGAGLLGAGLYGANALLNRGSPQKPSMDSKSVAKDGKPAKKGPSKIRFDIPTESMPPEFFQGLLKAEESGKGRAKYACYASRAELLQEIEQDLEFLSSPSCI